jgi:hypothetical protein
LWCVKYMSTTLCNRSRLGKLCLCKSEKVLFQFHFCTIYNQHL